MSDPQTSQLGLYQPTRGSDPGTWDSPINANTGATDTLFGTVTVLALSSSNVTLSTPPNSGASWSGPYQSQTSIIRLTGAVLTNITVTLPRAGFWTVENLTSTTSSGVVFISSSAPGNVIVTPPGEISDVYCDGVNVKFRSLGPIGSYMLLSSTNGVVPAWITSCTVPPFLNCDGSTFSAVTYPYLNARLGTNVLPDFRGRTWATLNQGTSRITSAGSGVDGNTMSAAGGSQNQTITQSTLPNYNLAVTDPGHSHTAFGALSNVFSGAGGQPGQSLQTTSTSTTGISVNLNGGGNPLTTMPPATVGGIVLIRAA